MGNSSTKVLLEAAQADCAEAADRFFSLLLKADAIATAESKQQPASSSHTQLGQPPSDIEPLMQGWLLKLSANSKAWKARYFVVQNLGEGSQIQYYDRDSDTKPAGSFSPCGLEVEALLTASDVERWGRNVICLRPRAPLRRRYLLRCGSEADLPLWLAAFRTASRRAPPPFVSRPLLSGAFRDAYCVAWRVLNLPGSPCFDRPEPEQLALLLLANTQQKRYITDSSSKSSPEDSSTREMEKAVLGIAAAAWAANTQLLELRLDALERIATTRFADIDAMRLHRRRELKRIHGKDLERLVHDSAAVVLPALLESVAPLIWQSFFLSLDYVGAALSDIIERRSQSFTESELRELYCDANWRNASLGGALDGPLSLLQNQLLQPPESSSIPAADITADITADSNQLLRGNDTAGVAATGLSFLLSRSSHIQAHLVQGLDDAESAIRKLLTATVYSLALALEVGAVGGEYRANTLREN